MDETFGMAQVLVMAGTVVPCSNYVSRRQVLAESPEEYCPGFGSISGSYGNQDLDCVPALHVRGVESGACPRVTMTLVGVRPNEVFVSDQSEGRRKMQPMKSRWTGLRVAVNE